MGYDTREAAVTFIKLDSIGKRRGKRWVFEDVSFEVGQGDVVAIVGDSGSGKSTLLRCINRLTEPSKGSIFVDGSEIRTLSPPELRRQLSMVFQFPAVFPGSVKQNVQYGLELMGGKSEERVLRAIEDVGLDVTFLKRNAEKLSGGELQRVCLARSLAVGPKALLLDEPTSSLDSKAARKIEQTVRELKENRGLAILWVTHDIEQAKRMAPKAVMLGRGRVEGTVSIDDIGGGDVPG
jgi:putative ABC transport system ATP-binding protein